MKGTFFVTKDKANNDGTVTLCASNRIKVTAMISPAMSAFRIKKSASAYLSTRRRASQPASGVIRQHSPHRSPSRSDGLLDRVPDGVVALGRVAAPGHRFFDLLGACPDARIERFELRHEWTHAEHKILDFLLCTFEHRAEPVKVVLGFLDVFRVELENDT